MEGREVYKLLTNFLFHNSKKYEFISLSLLERELSLSVDSFLPYLLELSRTGVLEPKIRVMCPYCGSEVGIYSDPNEVPSDIEDCEICNEKIRLDRKEGWEIIFRINKKRLNELLKSSFFR